MSLLSLLFIHVHSFLETVKAKLSFKLDNFPLFPVLVLNETVDWKFKTSSNSYIGLRVGRPQTSSSPPVIFIAGRPKAALLFWFFGDFRCGALLFMVIHVIYKYKNKYK